jgi:hypothetical protein
LKWTSYSVGFYGFIFVFPELQPSSGCF